MKKQPKQLELRKDRVISLSAMRHIKAGYTGGCYGNGIIAGTGMATGPHLITSVGAMCPTMAQGNTMGC